MTKRFCDCCEKEIKSVSMPIEIPCHHTSPLKGGYVDKEGLIISQRYDKFDLCNCCSNLIFTEAMKKFYEIQKYHKE